VGDELVAVNDEQLTGLLLPQVQSLIVGPIEGGLVKLSFRSGRPYAATRRTYEVFARRYVAKRTWEETERWSAPEPRTPLEQRPAVARRGRSRA
jgi:hypothetical protein